MLYYFFVSGYYNTHTYTLLMSSSTITNVSSANMTGECSEKCSMNVHSQPYSVSLRWNLNAKGGVIHVSQLNYDRTTANDFTFNQERYNSTGTFTIDFYKNTDITINGTVPDAILTMPILNSGGTTVTLIVPFKRGNVITPGSEIINKIITQLVTYQPNAGDPKTRLEQVKINDLLPLKGKYFDAIAANGKDHYIIVETIQAIKSSDIDKVNSLFNLGSTSIQSIMRLPGKKLNIAAYYRSKGSLQHNVQGKGGDDQIYIKCQPVGASTDKIPVTVKHDKVSATSMLNSPIFLGMIGIILAILLLYCINLVIVKYAGE